MKPVDQTTFGVPHGNCFSACVASLLELPIEDVPMFNRPDEFAHEDPDVRGRWFWRLVEWLEPRGFYPLCFEGGGEFAPRGFHIIGGQSTRGPHSVVGKGADIVHDPNPTREGLVKREDVVVLIPIDPSRVLAPVGEAGCNGVSSRWCPRCGDCTCPRDDDAPAPMDSPNCPLHAATSAHAEPS